MIIWKKEIENYENEIKDKILTEEEIMFALEKKLTEVRGFEEVMKRHHYIKQNAKRLATYKPRFVESVEDFETLR